MARVLVIEDNPASLELMTYLLKAFGFEAISARDGIEGIETAKREQPDLILCDIQLPGADGHEVCRQLKQDPAQRKVPLLAVTAYAMVGDREKLLAEGFNGYLSKPINPQTFIEQLSPYLRQQQFEAATAEVPPAALPEPRPVFQGTILVVDNSPVNISLSRSMLEPFGYDIIEAGTVDAALQVLEREIPDAILSDVHMPLKDGFDLIQTVKADARFAMIPFLFVSSTLWAERERVLGLSLGAANFLLRPIEPRALIAEIEASRSQAKGT